MNNTGTDTETTAPAVPPMARLVLVDAETEALAKTKWAKEIGNDFGQVWIKVLTADDVEFLPQEYDGSLHSSGWFEESLPADLYGQKNWDEDNFTIASAAAELAERIVYRASDEDWYDSDTPHDQQILEIWLSESSWREDNVSTWIDALRVRQAERGFDGFELWIKQENGTAELA